MFVVVAVTPEIKGNRGYVEVVVATTGVSTPVCDTLLMTSRLKKNFRELLEPKK